MNANGGCMMWGRIYDFSAAALLHDQIIHSRHVGASKDIHIIFYLFTIVLLFVCFPFLRLFYWSKLIVSDSVHLPVWMTSIIWRYEFNIFSRKKNILSIFHCIQKSELCEWGENVRNASRMVHEGSTNDFRRVHDVRRERKLNYYAFESILRLFGIWIQ